MNILPANTKSMNAMEKSPHIIELLDCILNMLAFIFLFPGYYLMNSLISSATWLTPKLLK